MSIRSLSLHYKICESLHRQNLIAESAGMRPGIIYLKKRQSRRGKLLPAREIKADHIRPVNWKGNVIVIAGIGPTKRIHRYYRARNQAKISRNLVRSMSDFCRWKWVPWAHRIKDWPFGPDPRPKPPDELGWMEPIQRQPDGIPWYDAHRDLETTFFFEHILTIKRESIERIEWL